MPTKDKTLEGESSNGCATKISLSSPSLRFSSPAVQHSVFPKISTPLHRNLSLLFSTSHKPSYWPVSTSKAAKFIIKNTLVLKRDKRLGDAEVSCAEPVMSSRTIAAIVTSLGGPPGEVGIGQLSGSSMLSTAGKVFQPMARKRRKGTHWWPNSHALEYGMVLDPHGNLIDETKKGLCNVHSCFLSTLMLCDAMNT